MSRPDPTRPDAMRPDAESLRGKVVLVTGSGHGLVTALATGKCLEAVTQERLTRDRESRSADHQVHHERAHYDDARRHIYSVGAFAFSASHVQPRERRLTA